MVIFAVRHRVSACQYTSQWSILTDMQPEERIVCFLLSFFES